MKVKFKNAFLKDIEKLPSNYRERIEKIVFDQIPRSDNLQMIKNLKKIRADNLYYRIRVGDYRIGFKDRGGELVFMRPYIGRISTDTSPNRSRHASLHPR